MRRTFRLVASALALMAVPATSQAAEPGQAEARNGPYLGVQPGLRDTAPGKVDVKSRGAVRVATWVGFQMQGGGGRVFVQTTEPAVYNLVPAAADEVVIELTDTRLQSQNDGRRLETTYFPTAVAWVDAEQKKSMVTVTIKLREIVGYDLRQEGNYLILDFRPPTQPIVLPGSPSSPPSDVAPAESAAPPT